MLDYWERKEEMWDDYFAKGDAIRERYACQIEDARREAEHDEYENHLWSARNAGFDSVDEYEAHWTRTEEYVNSGAVNDLF